MSNFLGKLKETFINPKFLAFCGLGFVNTFNAGFFSWLGHLFMQKNAAAVFGYIISLIINFFLNSRFIFKSNPNWIRFLRFLVSYIPNFIIYFLVTFIMINTLHLPQFWGTAISAAVGGPITFVIIKFYAFGRR